MNTLPLRRTDLLSRALGDETVVVDSAENTAHALTPLAASVFALCDGKTSVAAAAAQLSLSESDVTTAVFTLTSLGLVDMPGMTRRRAMQRAGLIGGGVLAVSIAAPLAAAHASDNTVTGQFYAQGDNSNTPGTNPTTTPGQAADGTYSTTAKATPAGAGTDFTYSILLSGLTAGQLYTLDYRGYGTLQTFTPTSGTASLSGDSAGTGFSYNGTYIQFDIYLTYDTSGATKDSTGESVSTVGKFA